MLAAHRAGAAGQVGHDDAVGCQIVHRRRDGHDIGDGVHSAHLVEMHLIYRHAVGPGLGVGHEREDAPGDGLGALGHGRALDDRLDLPGTPMAMPPIGHRAVPVPVPVRVVVPVRVAVVAIAASSLPVAVEIDHVVVMVLMGRIEHHVEVAHVQARLHHSCDVNGKPLHIQAFERRAHYLFPRADVQQGRRAHVAADARSAFQIQKPGHVSSFASSNG